MASDISHAVRTLLEALNARLAARLTGWRIDIRPDNEAVPAPAAVGE